MLRYPMPSHPMLWYNKDVMMNHIRKNLKTIMWVLVLLIVPTFVLWGVGSSTRSSQGPAYAGTLLGKRISWDEYRKSWLACRNQLFFSYGAAYRDVLDTLALEEEAWTRLILLRFLRIWFIMTSLLYQSLA